MNRLPLRCATVFRRLLSTPSTPELKPPRTPLKLLDLHVPYPKHIENTISLATANQEEITQHRISVAIEKYKKHDSDTGSAIVQLAVMTERIYNLARHFAMHKKDKAGQRGFQILLARRRKMMKYLRDKNFEEYREAVKVLRLEREAIHLQ